MIAFLANCFLIALRLKEPDPILPVGPPPPPHIYPAWELEEILDKMIRRPAEVQLGAALSVIAQALHLLMRERNARREG